MEKGKVVIGAWNRQAFMVEKQSQKTCFLQKVATVSEEFFKS